MHVEPLELNDHQCKCDIPFGRLGPPSQQKASISFFPSTSKIKTHKKDKTLRELYTGATKMPIALISLLKSAMVPHQLEIHKLADGLGGCSDENGKLHYL